MSPWHIQCLKTPLTAVPAGDWFCPDCSITTNGDGVNLLVLGLLMGMRRPRKDRLSWVTRDYFMSHSRDSGLFDDNILEFQKKIVERSGIGEHSYFPGDILASPPRLTMKEARAEAEMVMFGALDELFEKSRVRPKDIRILV
ncbi:hypothetical protein KI387_041057, partial [Taxus chinensis]